MRWVKKHIFLIVLTVCVFFILNVLNIFKILVDAIMGINTVTPDDVFKIFLALPTIFLGLMAYETGEKANKIAISTQTESRIKESKLTISRLDKLGREFKLIKDGPLYLITMKDFIFKIEKDVFLRTEEIINRSDFTYSQGGFDNNFKNIHHCIDSLGSLNTKIYLEYREKYDTVLLDEYLWEISDIKTKMHQIIHSIELLTVKIQNIKKLLSDKSKSGSFNKKDIQIFLIEIQKATSEIKELLQDEEESLETKIKISITLVENEKKRHTDLLIELNRIKL